MEHDFLEGIRLFNAQRYFEAHEALEAVWLKATGDRKTFLQGLIQVAAAFHHHMRHNPAGFRSLLEKGCTKLATLGAEFESVELTGLMLQLQLWQEYVLLSPLSSPPAPPLPHIKLKGEPGRG